MSRLLALLTDFGYRDAYAGILKGVILSRAPEVRVVDITHGIPPQDILAGALQLASAVPYFPADTVFLAVVDPGVGGARRPLCIRCGQRLFVGPDNGLLWMAAHAAGTPEAFCLDRPEFWLPEQSTTFHGRDIFAPVAAALAGTTRPEHVGSPLSDPVRLELPAPEKSGACVTGQVVVVDTYGNAATNLRPADLGNPAPDSLLFHIAGRVLRGPSTHYGAVAPGQPALILNSVGLYEVAVIRGSAATDLGLRRGSGIEVTSTIDGCTAGD